MIEDLLQREFYHNRISEYLLCLAIIVGGILAVRIVEALVLRRLKAWAEKTSRVHFLSCGDFSLVHEIVSCVDGNDYTRYMDMRQAANLRVCEES